MDIAKINKYVATFVAGYIVISSIVDYGEDPHLHPEVYESNVANTATYSITVSGTQSGIELPENMKYFEANPDREGENFYIIDIPVTQFDDWSE